MGDSETWRVANDMIRQYGAQAAHQAEARADKLLEQGYPDDAAEWKRVAEAIRELARKTPGDSDPLH